MEERMLDEARLIGTYHFVHKDADGKVIKEWSETNLITSEGKTYILNAAIHNTTAVSTWYFEIFTSGSASATHTYATPARTAATSAITEATRQAWGEGTAVGGTLTNATAATITANGALVVTGVAVVGSPGANSGDSTKGDVACSDGVMLSDLDTAKTLADTETLDITYTISAT